MRTTPRLAAISVASLAMALIAIAPAQAAGGDRYVGATSDGRTVKLVTDSDGAVVRGAITTVTTCTGGFDPFRARFELKSPLDRSSRERFKDSGSSVQKDDRFSARYHHEIQGRRRGPNVLHGSFDLTVVFSKDGDEYTTCTAEHVKFEARLAGSD